MGRDLPGLSVLTIAKGRTDHLLQLVEGLRRSACLPTELIIIDMNRDQVSPPPAPFAIHVIHHSDFDNALPLAQARNLAAAAARFDHLLFLDVDCIPMRGLVAAVTAALKRSDALICAEIHYLAAEDARDWREEDLLRTAQKHPLRQFPAHGLRFEENLGLFWSLAFAIRKDRFHALGGFDERFYGYGAEDTDFGLRAGKAGLRLAFLGGPGAFHQHHAVYDPPLNRWEDIARNAQLFHDIHKTWAMEGWLDAFQAMKLIKRADGKIIILREPTKCEIAGARRGPSRRF